MIKLFLVVLTVAILVLCNDVFKLKDQVKKHEQRLNRGGNPKYKEPRNKR